MFKKKIFSLLCMNVYTRKRKNGNYSARIDLPGITPRCWKNGKRVKCPRKSKVKFVTPIVRKTRKNAYKPGCWNNGKRVKCSTLIPLLYKKILGSRSTKK